MNVALKRAVSVLDSIGCSLIVKLQRVYDDFIDLGLNFSLNELRMNASDFLRDRRHISVPGYAYDFICLVSTVYQGIILQRVCA